MKSKYFNISENQNGTYRITTRKGRVIDTEAQGYEINPKQPRFIKIRHDGGAWCSLFNERGYALKDTMWVNDVVVNDDGTYRVQEYVHDDTWKHYDNGVSAKRFWNKCAIYFSGIVLSGGILMMNYSAKARSYPPAVERRLIKQDVRKQKVSSSAVHIPSSLKERTHE